MYLRVPPCPWHFASANARRADALFPSYKVESDNGGETGAAVLRLPWEQGTRPEHAIAHLEIHIPVVDVLFSLTNVTFFLLQCAPPPVSAGYEPPQRAADGLPAVWTASAGPAPSPPAGAAPDERVAAAHRSPAAPAAAACADAARPEPSAQAPSPHGDTDGDIGAPGAACDARLCPSSGYAARRCSGGTPCGG